VNTPATTPAGTPDTASAVILRCWHEALAVALDLRERKEHELADRVLRLADRLSDAGWLARHEEGGAP
jgi:hypothetical protein